ncbi:competence/damage-inducible protein A [Pikeienuella piscinae]|uniref:Competence/damage-inducible protein A n=1 Tax=Pikeienuella piscinae TaxID=2748098 RepID=A0A7L5BV58_9RHOB|nr:molybdopterin-binding protein [Pikeienuella piscinae]QIE55715.1 competence/damage-inducible protein A [Pikeienuella piscinae]
MNERNSQPTAAMIVIGDEVLSGRTREGNAWRLAGVMTEIGVSLREIRVIADDRAAIVEAVNALRARFDHVFTSGGIGPTHDDITADSIAAAFGVKIDVRDDARAILTAHYKAGELNESRLRMARIPDGATLIRNPVSQAPGFTIGNVHVMAGVPEIFAAMLEEIRPTLKGGAPLLSWSIRVEAPEGELATPLGAVAARHPDVSFGSYPFYRSVAGSTLVARAQDRSALEAAVADLRAALKGLGIERYEETPPG